MVNLCLYVCISDLYLLVTFFFCVCATMYKDDHTCCIFSTLHFSKVVSILQGVLVLLVTAMLPLLKATNGTANAGALATTTVAVTIPYLKLKALVSGFNRGFKQSSLLTCSLCRLADAGTADDG